MKKGHILLLSIGFCIGVLPAAAQGNRNINQTIYSNQYSTTIEPLLVLSSSSTLTLPSFTNASELENGLESSPINLAIGANVNWKLTTEIGVITYVLNGDSPALINSPLTFANFTFSTTDVNDVFLPFTPFNINFQAVTKTGTLGNPAVSGNTFNLKLKITPGYEVDPAYYTVPIILTLSGQ
ncbi:MAG: hypothetical protein WBJ10_14915 [Daejeonella sp.]|uniref:hypothetical protein n=1 Tax=Daejeonella sp. TaxID=2805397 RepID=UPI003C70D088